MMEMILMSFDGKMRRYSVMTESLASVIATQYVVTPAMNNCGNLRDLACLVGAQLRLDSPGRTAGCS